MSLRRLSLASALLCGCGPAGGPLVFVEIVDHEAWEMLAESEDPFVDHRPAAVECLDEVWGYEAPGLEIATNGCNYFAVSQALLEPIPAGGRVRFSVLHADLIAAEAAEGHVAMLIDGDLVAEQTIVIPGPPDEARPAEVLEFEGVVATQHPAGATVVFHLHNHGYNSWKLFSVEAETPAR